jgi:RNA polymerase sigma-70 factor, ECF subfamily
VFSQREGGSAGLPRQYKRNLSTARTDPGTCREDDVSLVAAVLRKDRKATAKLVELHADAIYSYVASRLVPRMEKVDDLTQEIFLAAWKSLADYRGDSPLRSWLLGIARHKVEDYYRAKLRLPEPLPVEEAGELPDEPDLELDEILDQTQLGDRVRRIIDSMSRQYALLLLWRYWEERSAREISQQIGRTEKAVERMLARARADFRARWSNA